MMKFYRRLLLLLAILSSLFVDAQTTPSASGYVEKNGGAFKTEQIYLRGSTVHQRTGFVVFPVEESGSAFKATVNLAVKNFRDDLANPVTVDIHVATGDLFTPLQNEADAFASAPDPTTMTLAATFTVDESAAEGDIFSIDVTEAYNELILAGAAEFITFRINSETGNAFLTFSSIEESDLTLWPSLNIISDDDIIVQSTFVDGFLQNGKDLVTSDIYVRGQGGTDAGFHREGYIVLEQKEEFSIIDAKLQLTARVDTRATGAAPDTIPQFVVGLAEGDLISGILNDGTIDWDQRPSDDSFSILDTLRLYGVLAGEVVEVDLTNEINSFITGGTVDMYTLRLMDTTLNSVLARFHTSSDADETKRPKLQIISSCAAELIEIDSIVCSTGVPFTLEAEEAANNIQVTENGIYDVLFTTGCGAVLTRRYAVDIIDNGDFNEDVSICAGEEFLGKTETEIFVVEKQSSDGSCTEKITYNLTVQALPVPVLGEDQIMLDDESITLDAGLWESYEWSTGETTQTIAVELSSESYELGDNVVTVTVTDANGCNGSDEVIITINDQSIPTTTEIPTMREDKDGFFDLGTRVEIKNDLYGDLNTPEGEGPFFNRIIFMEFDATTIADEIGTDVLLSAALQMYNYDNDEVSVGTRADLIHDTNVELGAAVMPLDASWTWSTQPTQTEYPIQDVVLVKEESVPSFYQWDITDFLAETVLGAGESIFSVRLSTREDTASTLIKFRSPKYSAAAERPKLLYEFGVPPLSTKGELSPTLLVYPNPSYDVIKLQADIQINSYSILDLNGKLIQKGLFDDSQTDEISISSLENGMYLLRLDTSEGRKTSRFLKL